MLSADLKSRLGDTLGFTAGFGVLAGLYLWAGIAMLAYPIAERRAAFDEATYPQAASVLLPALLVLALTLPFIGLLWFAKASAASRLSLKRALALALGCVGLLASVAACLAVGVQAFSGESQTHAPIMTTVLGAFLAALLAALPLIPIAALWGAGLKALRRSLTPS